MGSHVMTSIKNIKDKGHFLRDYGVKSALRVSEGKDTCYYAEPHMSKVNEDTPWYKENELSQPDILLKNKLADAKWVIDELVNTFPLAERLHGSPVFNIKPNEFFLGQRVKLSGLTRDSCNGRSGITIQKVQNDRWKVLLDDGTLVVTKPENLLPLESEAQRPIRMYMLKKFDESFPGVPSNTGRRRLLRAELQHQQDSRRKRHHL